MTQGPPSESEPVLDRVIAAMMERLVGEESVEPEVVEAIRRLADEGGLSDWQSVDSAIQRALESNE